MKRRPGFTLVELLTVVVIIIILVSLAMPSLGRAVELGRRTKCRGNLDAIGDAMRQYASEDPENPVFPIDSPTISGTSYIGSNWSQRSYDVTETDHTGSISSQAGNSRSMFVVVREGSSLKQFICPSMADHKVNEEVDPNDDYDFRTEKEVSYSFQVQKTLGGGIPTFFGDPASKIILADRSPISGIDTWGGSSGRHPTVDADSSDAMKGGFDEKNKNSFNHSWNDNQEGQNVATVSGTIKWVTTPFCGAEDEETNAPDNIWCLWAVDGTGLKTGDTIGGGDLDGRGPQNEIDSFLWP